MAEENANIEITAGKRFASNLIAALTIILCSVLILLCGLDVFSVSVGLVIAPAVLASLGIILLSNSFIQSNTVSLYLAVLFIMFAVVSILANFVEGLSYGELYPLYIAAPAVSSLATMLMSKNYFTHIKIAMIFGVPAFVFFMQSFGIWNWGITVAAIMMFVGVIALYATMALRSHPEE